MLVRAWEHEVKKGENTSTMYIYEQGKLCNRRLDLSESGAQV